MPQINDFLQAASSFAQTTTPYVGLFGITTCNLILARQFNQHRELDKVPGVYIFSVPESGRVLYIGESEGLFGRFIQHSGRAARFNTDGECFPNFDLIKNYHWATPETKQVIKSGNFHVHVILVEPPTMRWLLESFLIAYGRANGNPPELNVRG
ncbi:MAG: hypothetical protein IT487_18670 [Chromatiaceae bacterium]|nr:hypothetical protein [Chromatiaceae bacterium]